MSINKDNTTIPSPSATVLGQISNGPETGFVLPDAPLVDESRLSSTERERRARERQQQAMMTKEQAAASDLMAFLMLLFIGSRKEDSKTGVNNPEFQQDVSSALGIDLSVFSNAVSRVRSDKVSAYDAASEILRRTDPAKAPALSDNLDRAVKKHYGLENLPPAGNANFLKAVDVILKLEGGWNPNEPDGGVANFGINNRANPDIDVRNLTKSGAVLLYKDRYWDKINGIEKLDQRTALAVFDLAVNSGVGTANKFLRESGGDLDKLMEMRQKHYARLVTQNPEKYARYEKSWNNRMKHLEVAMRAIPSDSTLQQQFAKGGVEQKPSQGNLTTAFKPDGTDEVARASASATVAIAKAKAKAASDPLTITTTKPS